VTRISAARLALVAVDDATRICCISGTLVTTTITRVEEESTAGR
jgi:hypothetical protein